MAALSGLYRQVNSGLFRTAKGRAMSFLAGLLLAGALLSFFNVPLASSAANSVQIVHMAEAVPTDPMSPVWNRAQEAEIPLSSQQIYQPGGGTTRAVKVRTLEDGQTIAFRVSWADDTRNDTTGSVPSVAAAIQLPIDPTNLPYQCMGQSNNRVNIWQWKAALEREGGDNLGAQALENAGVRNLTANGICKAVDTAGAEPKVKSFHDGKEWHVVFYRAMAKGGPGTAPLNPGVNSAVAFAVWNGARGEARGMKAVSTWNSLQFSAGSVSDTGNLVMLAIVIAVAAGAVGYTMRRMAGA